MITNSIKFCLFSTFLLLIDPLSIEAQNANNTAQNQWFAAMNLYFEQYYWHFEPPY